MITPSDKIGLEFNGLEKIRQAAKSTAPETEDTTAENLKLIETCQQFEEIFLRIILKEANIDRSLFSQKEAGSKLYSDLTRETMAKALTQAGGFGLAEVLFEQLNKQNLSQVEPDSAVDISSEDPE
ncbi:MAG: rod-binding protein [bacterium]